MKHLNLYIIPFFFSICFLLVLQKTDTQATDKAKITSTDHSDISVEEKASSDLSNAHRSQGEFQTAIEYNELHLKIAKELRDKSEKGAAYCYLGITHYKLGDFKTAIHYQDCYLKIAK